VGVDTALLPLSEGTDQSYSPSKQPSLLKQVLLEVFLPMPTLAHAPGGKSMGFLVAFAIAKFTKKSAWRLLTAMDEFMLAAAAARA